MSDLSQSEASDEKAMTLRISVEQHEALVWIAKLNESSVSEEIRIAIRNFIEDRRRDPGFQDRLRMHRAEQNAIYDRLSK